MTWYASDAELPPTISEYNLYSGKGITYRFYTGVPTVPFGFGLSCEYESCTHARTHALCCSDVNSFPPPLHSIRPLQ